MPSPHELVAHGRTTAEIAAAIGADLVIFQTLPDLIASVQQFNPSLKAFDCSVFSGEYVTGGVDDEYLRRVDNLRSEIAKEKIASELPPGVGLTNGKVHDGPLDLHGLAQHNGPLNGADETIGLHNTWTATPPNELANRNIIS
jgi:amidophosphoribosyltransferase